MIEELKPGSKCVFVCETVFFNFLPPTIVAVEVDVNQHVFCVHNKANTYKGVFLVKVKDAFVPVRRVDSMNTYSRISTVPRWSKQSE